MRKRTRFGAKKSKSGPVIHRRDKPGPNVEESERLWSITVLSRSVTTLCCKKGKRFGKLCLFNLGFATNLYIKFWSFEPKDRVLSKVWSLYDAGVIEECWRIDFTTKMQPKHWITLLFPFVSLNSFLYSCNLMLVRSMEAMSDWAFHSFRGTWIIWFNCWTLFHLNANLHLHFLAWLVLMLFNVWSMYEWFHDFDSCLNKWIVD